MRKKVMTAVVACCLLLFAATGLTAQTSRNSLLVQGLEAYRRGDWISALFFLRNAATRPENMNAETYYVLVMSEMYAGDYESVLADGSIFLENFPKSTYLPQIEYQMARSHFIRESYSEAVQSFTAFCNAYPDHELMPSALFWMAESLYQTFHFEEARPVFERIVQEYPESSKVTEAAFRIELLNQREREEKLLYLLRVTGEEYLSAREDYERQIRESQTDEEVNLRKSVTSLQLQIDALQKQLEAELARNSALTSRMEYLVQQNSDLQRAAEDAARVQQRASQETGLSGQTAQQPSETQATATVPSVTDVPVVQTQPEPVTEVTSAPVVNEELSLLKQKALLMQILMGDKLTEGGAE